MRSIGRRAGAAHRRVASAVLARRNVRAGKRAIEVSEGCEGYFFFDFFFFAC